MSTAIVIILLVAIVIYAIFGGADFGAGVWEFNTALKSSDEERELLYKAIGPVWETNHVWLIFVMVILFGAFPPVFASLNQALFLPLFLALVGIVFRGAAYAFRSPLKREPDRKFESQIWVAVFALASVMAPYFLGASVGAVASGELNFDSDGNYIGGVMGWVNLLSLFTGFFTVGICAYCASSFMIRESHLEGQTQLAEIWRRRSIAVGIVMGLLALAGLLLIWAKYPTFWQRMLDNSWFIILLSMLTGVFSLVAIFKRWHNVSTVAVSTTCATVIVGWAMAQYPELVPGVWTIESAASPSSVQLIILISIGIGAIFLLPAIWLLFKIFKSET